MGQGASPLVSVVMAVYNGELYLKEAMDSILTQTYRNLEFIVVDDGSTDSTPAILSDMKDPRVKVLRNEVNSKTSFSLNRAAEVARGKYIARMDSDDISLPDRIARQVDYMERYPEIDVLGSAIRYIGAKKGKHIYRQNHDDIFACMFYRNEICHPAVMLRVDTVRERYDDSCKAGQDYELWSRLIAQSRFHNLREVLHLYRIHEKQARVVLMDSQKTGAMKAQSAFLGMAGCELTQEEYRAYQKATLSSEALPSVDLLIARNAFNKINAAIAMRYPKSASQARRASRQCLGVCSYYAGKGSESRMDRKAKAIMAVSLLSTPLLLLSLTKTALFKRGRNR